MAKARSQDQCITPGYWVAFALRPGTAPLRSYAGKVRAVDQHGVHIILMDWLIGTASGFDLFVPWTNIESALIATPQQDTKQFGEKASKWQRRMCGDADDGERDRVGAATGPEESPEEQQQDRRRVLKALRNPEYTWRTVSGIAKEAGLSKKRVRAVLARPGRLIIESDVPDGDGNALFGRIDHDTEASQPTSSMWWKLVRAAGRAGFKVGISEGGRLITGGLPVGELLDAIQREL